jgi:hypothetical protein
MIYLDTSCWIKLGISSALGFARQRGGVEGNLMFDQIVIIPDHAPRYQSNQ